MLNDIPSCLNPGRRENTNLNFYFHTSLWSLKRFSEGLKGVIFILIQLSEISGAGLDTILSSAVSSDLD